MRCWQLFKYPLTLLVFAAMCYLSFFSPPETPLDEVRFIDKWTHLCMYGGFSATWFYEYFKQHGLKGLRLKTIKTETLDWGLCSKFALYFPILLGGVIEILQEYCTNHRRSGEVIDWIADALGSVLVFCLVWLLVSKNKNRVAE